jgi:putrescine aminotransferase
MSRFWHPFADMHTVADHELVMVEGEGAVVRDADGREYIDATAGLWFCNVGYGRQEIADAVANQLSKLSAWASPRSASSSRASTAITACTSWAPRSSGCRS